MQLSNLFAMSVRIDMVQICSKDHDVDNGWKNTPVLQGCTFSVQKVRETSSVQRIPTYIIAWQACYILFVIILKNRSKYKIRRYGIDMLSAKGKVCIHILSRVHYQSIKCIHLDIPWIIYQLQSVLE